LDTSSIMSSLKRNRDNSIESFKVESLKGHSQTNLVQMLSSNKKTIHQLFIKKLYKRMIRRMEEDESSIWYDHLEQMKKDYADMREVYKHVNVVKPKEQGEEGKEDIFQQKNEYSYFIRQRRILDKWGRMMLLKPNRKYNKNKFW